MADACQGVSTEAFVATWLEANPSRVYQKVCDRIGLKPMFKKNNKLHK